MTIGIENYYDDQLYGISWKFIWPAGKQKHRRKVFANRFPLGLALALMQLAGVAVAADAANNIVYKQIRSLLQTTRSCDSIEAIRSLIEKQLTHFCFCSIHSITGVEQCTEFLK